MEEWMNVFFVGEQNENKTIFAVLEWILGGFVSDPGVEFLFHDSLYDIWVLSKKHVFFLPTSTSFLVFICFFV